MCRRGTHVDAPLQSYMVDVNDRVVCVVYDMKLAGKVVGYLVELQRIANVVIANAFAAQGREESSASEGST